MTGLFGTVVCTPPYAIARGAVVLLGSSTLFPLGVALLVIGLMLEAGATGAVKAIEVSAKPLAGRYPQTPGDQASAGLDAVGRLHRLDRQAPGKQEGTLADQRLRPRPARCADRRPGIRS